MDSEESHTLPGLTMVPSYEALTSPADSPNGSEKSQTEGGADRIGFSDGAQRGTSGGIRVGRSRSRGGVRSGSGIQRQAWQWAVANRTPEGDLPAGKAIASEFGRSERWGRLVKQAGLAGGL